MASVTFKLRNLETFQAIPLPPGEFLVGREAVCDVILQKKDTSRMHARLINDGHILWVHDLESSNGTYVRLNRIKETVPLVIGDLVAFANEWYRVDPEVSEHDHTELIETPPTTGELHRLTTTRLPRPQVLEKAPEFHVPIAKVPKPRIAPNQKRPGS